MTSESDDGAEAAAPDATQRPSAATRARRVLRGGIAVARSRPTRTTLRYLLVLLVTLVGMTGGLLLGGQRSAPVGPFHAHLAITPSLDGDTQVQIPPLGSLSLDSHDGPLHLTINLGSLDRKRAEALVSDPGGIQRASSHAISDLRTGVTELGIQAGLAMLLGALLLNLLVFRRFGRVAVAGGMVLVILAGVGLWTATTFRPDSVEEPRYDGLLTMAPAVVGDARSIAENYGQYSKELQHLVNNVAKLYGTVSNLPVYEPSEGTVRVLHISDMHLNPAAWGVVNTVVKQYNIDLIVDTGDLVDWGSKQEDKYIANISKITVPYIYVRGNHDSAATAAAVHKQGGIVLEDKIRTVKGITFAGIGDPRFTPDKSTEPAHPSDPEPRNEAVINSGRVLAQTIHDYDDKHPKHPVDTALVHDPGAAPPLAGAVPLVLAGHLHRRKQAKLGHDTRLMVEGSTGAAGLRGLEPKNPTPMEMSVLYYSSEHRVTAYDNITLGGTGQSQVTLQRHIIDESVPGTSPSGSTSVSPSTSGTRSPSPTPTRR